MVGVLDEIKAISAPLGLGFGLSLATRMLVYVMFLKNFRNFPASEFLMKYTIRISKTILFDKRF